MSCLRSFTQVLRHVFSYWESLTHGENEMPFWDDVKLPALPDLKKGGGQPFFTIALVNSVRSRVSSCRCGETAE
jgi:hypothetical protein